MIAVTGTLNAGADEQRQMYTVLGIVTYAEEEVKQYVEKHKCMPKAIIVGRLEWDELAPDDDTEFAIADVKVVPNLSVSHYIGCGG